MKRSRKRNRLSWLLRVLLLVAVFWFLTKYGINPFFSVLLMLYWKTVMVLGLLLGGIMYAAGIITF